MPDVPTVPTPTGPKTSPNKVVLVAVGVGVLLALAAGGYLFFGKSKDTATTTNNTTPPPSSTDNTSTKGSLKSLLDSRRTTTCSVSYGEGSATIYISGAKFYGEFDTKAEGQSYKGYVMSDGDFTYIWSVGSVQGIKMKLTDKDRAEAQSGFDWDQEGNLQCSNWTVDNSKFKTPSGVTFTELPSTPTP